MTDYVKLLQQKEATTLYQEQGINYLALFGSAARGEATGESDVDLLVDFNETKTLFDLADIQLYLENLLRKKVDLVTRKSVKPRLKPYIEQDLITVYEEN